MSRKTQYYPLHGGVNTEAPALSVPTGQLIDSLNYEPVTEGGYRRIDGFERYDGQLLASAAVYYTIPFDTGAHEPLVGQTVVGDSTLSEGVILAVVVDSGTWAGGDASGHLVVWVKSGAFISGEPLTIYHSVAFTTGFSSGFA